MDLRERARAIRRDTFALYLACRDPRVPWYAKVLAGVILAYALSPLDLIPDFIPVLGYLDDLLIIPAGLVLARRLIPRELLEEHRRAASERFAGQRAPASRAGLLIVVAIWLAGAVVVAAIVMRLR